MTAHWHVNEKYAGEESLTLLMGKRGADSLLSPQKVILEVCSQQIVGKQSELSKVRQVPQ